jgi:hypothetical protein
MNIKSEPFQPVKPLAGNCQHHWIDQESAFLVAQVCELCKLYRYRAAPISDWEYRAPIPRAAPELDWP